MVLREKAIYHTLNKLSMDASHKVRARGARGHGPAAAGPPAGCVVAGRSLHTMVTSRLLRQTMARLRGAGPDGVLCLHAPLP